MTVTVTTNLLRAAERDARDVLADILSHDACFERTEGRVFRALKQSGTDNAHDREDRAQDGARATLTTAAQRESFDVYVKAAHGLAAVQSHAAYLRGIAIGRLLAGVSLSAREDGRR